MRGVNERNCEKEKKEKKESEAIKWGGVKMRKSASFIPVKWEGVTWLLVDSWTFFHSPGTSNCVNHLHLSSGLLLWGKKEEEKWTFIQWRDTQKERTQMQVTLLFPLFYFHVVQCLLDSFSAKQTNNGLNVDRVTRIHGKVSCIKLMSLNLQHTSVYKHSS